MSTERLAALIGMLVVLAATAAIFWSGRMAGRAPYAIVRNPHIDVQVRFQVLQLLVAASVLATGFALSPVNFVRYAAMGNWAAPAASVPWLGIPAGELWSGLGLSLTVTISAVTALFMYFALRRSGLDRGMLRKYWPWILLLSATNAASEEAIYRLGIVVPLQGVATPEAVPLFCALAFGVPHWLGTPGGLAGTIMASLLGWVLAKSVIETEGIAWAWSIHFIQDVIIYSALCSRGSAANVTTTGVNP